MKKILVTGGLGFIGSNFIRLLLKDGGFEKIINYDKLTYLKSGDLDLHFLLFHSILDQ